MADLAALNARNSQRWAVARITRGPEFDRVATRLVMSKPRYQALSDKTGVPWFVIAVIHEREAGQNFTKSIAQGDAWNAKSVNDPKGRGPFRSFEEAAIDALTFCAPYAAKWKDWSAGGTMSLLEQYNGLGYAGGPAPTKGPNAGKHYPPQASPYIWSGTDQYKSGKYVADHDFRPEVVDAQLGCAGLIIAMQTLDHSIGFGVKPAPISPTAAAPAKSVAIGVSLTVGIVAWLRSYSIELAIGGLIVGVIVAIAIHFLWKKKD